MCKHTVKCFICSHWVSDNQSVSENITCFYLDIYRLIFKDKVAIYIHRYTLHKYVYTLVSLSKESLEQKYSWTLLCLLMKVKGGENWFCEKNSVYKHWGTTQVLHRTVLEVSVCLRGLISCISILHLCKFNFSGFNS